MEEFGEFLLQSGAFSMSQFGMNDAAKQGRMPADFVQRHWRDANTDARVELCKFAEAQLGEYGDEALHRFLVDVAFTPLAAAGRRQGVRARRGADSRRWYDSFGYPRRRPVKVSAESIANVLRLGPAVPGAVLEAILHERPHRAAIGEILRYPDSSALSRNRRCAA